VTQEQIEALFRQTKPTVTFEMLARYEKMQDKFGRRSSTIERTEVVTHQRLDWESICGMEDAKTALWEAVELPLLYTEAFREWGLKQHSGILLYGPPGCGKTMFAKVASDSSNSRFYTINGPELLGGGVGAAEKRLRELFDRAKENRPAIIFFDEIDAIAANRDSYAGAIQRPIVQQLLTQMDGKEALNSVVVIAATNRPDQLDRALLRPGRFDRLIYVPLPDEESRQSQWMMHLSGKPGADSIDYDRLTAASAGYSGAEIGYIAQRVAMRGLKAAIDGESGKSLQTEEIVTAIVSTPAQVSPEQVAAYEAIAARLSR
jgi:transitional endoplasmic reticulum ATPase